MLNDDTFHDISLLVSILNIDFLPGRKIIYISDDYGSP